jgi:N-acetylglutamate synthase-like GNAT family acetyltransferase
MPLLIGSMVDALQTRPASLEDASGIARLSTQLGYPVTETDMRHRLERLLASPTHLVAVAERKGTLLGWIAGEVRISIESEPRVEITGLVVDTTERRCGIGRMLVSGVEHWASRRQCQMVFVRSNVARSESHPFYEQLGYERAKTQHAYRKVLDTITPVMNPGRLHP